MPIDMNQDVAALAASVLGPQAGAPQGVPGEMPPGMGQAPAGPPKADPNAPPSQTEAAVTKASPTDEGDRSGQSPVVYEIPMGDKTRKMTPEQISSTLGRYADLNHKHAQYRPVLDVVEQFRAQNPNLSAQEITQRLASVLKANEKNPTMGQQTQGSDGKPGDGVPQDAKGKSADDIEAELARWEKDNAASLPPGYRDFLKGDTQSKMSAMEAQLNQMARAMQVVLAQAGGTADAARQSMGDAQSQKSRAIQQQIANNIDRVQQALALPDEKANDFMVFAAERGYTMEDFVDPGLTVKVMQDFKNQMDSPEMARLRSIAERRQAYTGSMGGSPGAQGASTTPPAAATPFDGLLQHVMSQKGMTR